MNLERYGSWPAIVLAVTANAPTERFWSRRNGRVAIFDGFLRDPTDGSVNFFGGDELERLSSLSEPRCVALLGEPGMGKSTALDDWRRAGEVGAAPVQFHDLREYGDESRLISDIFRSETISRWQANESEIHLVLDSLDECRSHIPNIGAVLTSQLRRLPTARLRLWIACRTGDWPALLESELKSQFHDDFDVFEIAPLRRDDVASAAVHAGVDGEAFMTTVEAAGVGPLAARPLTLNFLLEAFRSSGSLPRSQVDLYSAGVRQLCTEVAPARFGTEGEGKLSPNERLAIASRVAAAAWLCQRPVVRARTSASPISELEIAADDLAIGFEPTQDSLLEVRPEAVREVLGTGLFSARGPEQFGWAHESYGEFLAAAFLRSRLTNAQTLRVLTTGVTGRVRVVPQLSQIAAWAIALGPGLEPLVQADPAAIANAGVAIDDSSVREDLTRALLDAAAADELQREFGLDYRHLAHDGISGVLEPVLLDHLAPLGSRMLAAQIARDIPAAGLTQALSQLALDDQEPFGLRLRAAYAVRDCDDPDAKQQLLPLVEGGTDDPDDELKGVALGATWPSGYPAGRLFRVLTPPRRRNLLGAYRMFIRRELPDRVGPHLGAAIEWLAAMSSDELRSHEDLVETLAVEMWRHADDPEIRAGLARLILKVLRGSAGDLDHLIPRTGLVAQFRPSDDARQSVLLEVLRAAEPSDVDSILVSHPRLAAQDDFAFLVRHALLAGGDASAALVQLAGDLFSPMRVDHSDIACQVPRQHPLYRDHFAHWFEAVAVDSAEADEGRDRLAARAKRLEQLTDLEEGVSAEELRGRVIGELELFEAGDIDAWWRCCHHLTLAVGDTVYRSDLEAEPDLTQLPGWSAVAAHDADRFFGAARRYLEVGEPNVEEWWLTDSIWRPALAGYKSLVLMLRNGMDVATLPPEALNKWIPVIFRFPHLRQHVGDNDDQRVLIRAAVQAQPAAVANLVRRLFTRASDAGEALFERELVEVGWCSEVEVVLLEMFGANELHANTNREVLRLLLRHGVESAGTIAANRLTDLAPNKVASELAAELLSHEPSRWWPQLLPLCAEITSFGREVVTCLATSHERSKSVGIAAPQTLADLYLWVASEFPEAEDPSFEEAHFVGDRENIGRWRDGLLNQLVRQGTFESLLELRRVIAARPDAPWLQHLLLEAETVVRRESWQPLLLPQLLALAERPFAHVVSSSDDLLAAVLESLGRLQDSLNGQTPMAQFLWDVAGELPKNEDAISDYVTAWLRRDLCNRGVVVNREVEVRRVPGAPIGERTDIQVEASAVQPERKSFDAFTVVVEVKGDWNAELKTAMQTQLWERYMRDIRTTHGVFLVAWFGVERGKSTSKRAKPVVADLGELTHLLDQCADALSPEGATIGVKVLDATLPTSRS